MPAYTTVAFQFPKTSRAGLVRKVYDAFASAGLAFSHVHSWGCDANLNLDEIVDWNQTKLDQDFKLGFDEDVSNDYRQILLAGNPFSECRLYILNGDDSVAFHCIVPESEISDLNCHSIQNAADKIWDSLPVDTIDSIGEWADDDVTPPAASLFAYVDSVTPAMQPQRFDREDLARGCRLKRKQEAEQGGGGNSAALRASP
ncbi:MAG: hypothetical protein SFY80_02235 [Verrucomicrobiota bacterium]|nr:hypothetical protein [Verrucomicrobiota bacterium]